jgi:hypothetical protein
MSDRFSSTDDSCAAAGLKLSFKEALRFNNGFAPFLPAAFAFSRLVE